MFIASVYDLIIDLNHSLVWFFFNEDQVEKCKRQGNVCRERKVLIQFLFPITFCQTISIYQFFNLAQTFDLHIFNNLMLT